MQFEEFDKKIKEASEHYHPAYDETAWKKMNDLLNDQLPENKNDWRRIYYLLFLLIFVTTGGYLMVEKPWNSNNKIYPAKNVKNINSTPVGNPVISKENITTSNNNDVKKIVEQGSSSRSVPSNQSNFIPHNRNKAAGKDIISFNNKYRTPPQIFKNKINSNIKEEQGELIAGNILLPGTKDNSDSKNDVNEPTIEPLAVVPLDKTKNKKHKSFAGNLGFTISAGPDVSAFSASEPGKTTLYFGAGLRYDLSKRVTLKTGFYITDKIYSAAGKDYKQTYVYYPTYTLTSVDADCKIFEVPLIVNYNFIQRKKNNLFGTIGVSSFFMNREIYHYHYNDPMGQYRYGTKTYNNRNQHYFSVITLAAGYERKLNPIFSVAAEPYVKLPLSGVGEGKIKLNSAGLLVSVNIKPFVSKDQKK